MILADENIAPEIIQYLRSNGIEVVSVYEEYRGMPDEDVIKLAKQREGLIITEDKDFGEWAFSHKVQEMSVILLRFTRAETAEMKLSLLKLLQEKQAELFGSFTTLTVRKLRIRKL